MGPLLMAFGALATAFTWLAVFAVLRTRRERAPARKSREVRAVLLRPVEVLSARWVDRIAREASAMPDLTTLVCTPDESEEGSEALSRAGVTIVRSRPAGDAPCNRKVLHLAAGVAASLATPAEGARSRVFLQADADVVLERADVDALLDAFACGADDDVAFAVPSPRAEVATMGALVSQAILALSPQAFAVVDALGSMTGRTPAVAGKFLAISEATLTRIGGYEGISRAVADDVALLDRVSSVGGHAIRSTRAIAIDVTGASLGDVHARMVRWLRVIRAQRARLLVAYPLVIAPLPIALGLAAFASVAGQSAWLGWPFAILLASRLALAWSLARGPYAGLAPRPGLLLPVTLLVADAILLSAFAHAVVSRRIVWAGMTYDVDARGTITAARRA